jgi:hypothetical protein
MDGTREICCHTPTPWGQLDTVLLEVLMLQPMPDFIPTVLMRFSTHGLRNSRVSASRH